MDHDGPKPFLNNQKRATAAEQVSKRQDDYEAMGKPSSDKMKSVQTHNETYPKLREPLNRRKSMADVADMSNVRMLDNSKRSKKARKRGSRRDKQLSRVTKKRPRPCACTCSKCLLTVLSNSKSCQMSNYITVINRRIGTDPKMAETGPLVKPAAVVSETKVTVETEEPKIKPTSSKVDSHASATPTVSSYHSYYSTDHEPMAGASYSAIAQHRYRRPARRD